jgi:hypothetical protein
MYIISCWKILGNFSNNFLREKGVFSARRIFRGEKFLWGGNREDFTRREFLVSRNFYGEFFQGKFFTEGKEIPRNNLKNDQKLNKNMFFSAESKE